ncbi:hypothetical protein LCGC14_2126280 [marine sediment metagenome]|uniref:Uncharacterized protein n=1 Tax=marine sediment metagenome TaxID=412755 RepID=A0A0F9GFW9_9ZZZZ
MDCDHEASEKNGYRRNIWGDVITTMVCKKCHVLLDYYPQYPGDGVGERVRDATRKEAI